MRFAVIDLGTNSVRFDVYQFRPNKRTPERLHREKVMVRLGQGVFIDGRLDKNAIRRTYQAFLRFKKIAHHLHVKKVVAFGTSALREAQDSDKLTLFLRKKTGIDVRVISGQEEAQLIGKGILANETLDSGKLALIDIGGGSTEIIIVRNRKVLHAYSFPLGTARLQQLFLKRSPPRTTSVKELREYIHSAVIPVIRDEKWPRVSSLIGASGTIKALGHLLNNPESTSFKKKATKKLSSKKRPSKSSPEFSTRSLVKLVAQMTTMTTTQLLGVPRMEADRVDMILAGAILLEEMALLLGAKSIRPTLFSLRDGILEEQCQLIQQSKQSSLSLHLDDLVLKGERFGHDRLHTRRILALGQILFAKLQRLHKLDPQWKDFLLASLIFKDAGEAISPTAHPQHSYYIVNNAQLPSTTKSEAEVIALLCLHHEGRKPVPKQLPLADKSKRQKFLKTLALLRVIDAFDSDSRTKVTFVSVSVTSKMVKIRYRVRPSTDFEAIRVERKKMLFEEVFDRKLIVERVG